MMHGVKRSDTFRGSSSPGSTKKGNMQVTVIHRGASKGAVVRSTSGTMSRWPNLAKAFQIAFPAVKATHGEVVMVDVSPSAKLFRAIRREVDAELAPAIAAERALSRLA